MMAAAVFPTTRGLTRAATSKKGLVLVLSLLSLVHVASSLVDQHTLREMKVNLQTLEEEVARKKADHNLDKAFVLDMVDSFSRIMDFAKKIFTSEMPFFMAIPALIEDTTVALQESHTLFAKMFEEEAGEIRDNEETLRGLKERITSLEEHHSEL